MNWLVAVSAKKAKRKYYTREVNICDTNWATDAPLLSGYDYEDVDVFIFHFDALIGH